MHLWGCIVTELKIKQEPKCFNCNMIGHIAARCQMPKREKGACFKCLQLGHKAVECPSKSSTKKEPNGKCREKKTDVNSVFDEEIGDFHREVTYCIINEIDKFTLNCKLDTLLDTGSPISFIKDNFIPPHLISPILLDDDKYTGLNDSALEPRGRMYKCH
ncbi:Gag-Pol polyprotein [Trachymyrmex cornetzi]|uniref:Gag-Pol polyprotein n=1 Tax=Trachymyrmex cornetzi TaxID=471704 RepID=A0A151J7K7_9HYME|nr:Gag-Pol polyprotein [Trachymyrmex cornetzi]